MVGLPWERHEDVEAIVDLTEQIRDRMIEVGRSRGRVGRIHPSVNPFVPKPGTPYQWLPMEDPKETDRKLQFLRKAFGKMANVDAICKSARTGVSQSILALADRRVADALEFAAVNDVDLKRGMKAAGLDPALLSLPRPRPRGGAALGHRRQRRDPRATTCASSTRASRRSSRRTARRSRAASAARVCIETPNP